MTDTTEPPIACTLDAGNLKDRLEWIGKLNARSLLGSRRGDLSLTLDYALDAIGDVREMVASEEACCAFLAFIIDERADRVRVTITAPETAREAAEALFEPFAARAASAPAPKTCGCTSECGA
ncbi:MAG: hypothetical protein ABT11_20760 [Novosphingobium sp. SCN 66-18]|jgi:hypothetical protein|nr:MAG: hypothetical protein ABT11_20760 [Novosphingobium sp. SCN 66-18]